MASGRVLENDREAKMESGWGSLGEGRGAPPSADRPSVPASLVPPLGQ